MFNKTEENQRLSQWIKHLNVYTLGFINGDGESKKNKTADIVNHSKKIAVELKREKGGCLDSKNGNLEILSNRIEEYLKSANEKFRCYPKYKTILVIELETIITSAEVVMRGLPQIHFNKDGLPVSKSIRNKKFYSETQNIGAIILWPAPGNFFSVPYYFDNHLATTECKVTHNEAENIIGKKLRFFNL